MRVLAREVRPGGGLVLGPEVGLGHPPRHRCDAAVHRTADDGRINRGVVERIGAVLEAGARAADEGDTDVGQLADPHRHVHGDRRLGGRGAERKPQDHQLVPGNAGDSHRLPGRRPQQGVVEDTSRGERSDDDERAGDRKSEIARGDEVDAVIDSIAGAVGAGGRQDEFDEGPVAHRRAGVAEGDADHRGLADQRLRGPAEGDDRDRDGLGTRARQRGHDQSGHERTRIDEPPHPSTSSALGPLK